MALPAAGGAARLFAPGEGCLAEHVAHARDGDRAAFEVIVRATYEQTYSLAYRVVGNEHDACDVVQEAYLRAFRSLATFRAEAAFTTWLYRITANCAATYLDRRGRSRTEILEADAQVADERPASDPFAMAGRALERSQVSAALARLPDRLRAVIVLRDIYDLPHEAIAQELGITEATAKVRLHRARRKLRDTLDNERDLTGAGAGGR